MRRSMVQKREKRSHLRFNSESNTLAQISFDEKFKSINFGLVCNESYSGCSVVALKDKRLVDGAKCYIKCGKLASMQAAIRWVSELDEDSVRIGIEFMAN